MHYFLYTVKLAAQKNILYLVLLVLNLLVMVTVYYRLHGEGGDR